MTYVGSKPMRGTIIIRLEVDIPGVGSNIKLLSEEITKLINENLSVEVDNVRFSPRIRRKREGVTNNTRPIGPPYSKEHKRSTWYANASVNKKDGKRW